MANVRSRGGAPTGETHSRKSRTRESDSGASQSDASLSDEYHSYVMRVRAQRPHPRSGSRSGPRATPDEPTLSVRVEHVNTRQAMHFTELSGAFNFIADSLRRNVLHPDP
jgi:hypothetical protein